MFVVFLFGGLLLGLGLGLLFRVFVLVPTSFAAVVLVPWVGLHLGEALVPALIQACATVFFLQVGYFLALMPRLFPSCSLPVVTSTVRQRVRSLARHPGALRRR